MTRKATAVYGLEQKGLIEEGMDADIVIFDLENIDIKSTYTDSRHLATGYDYVIVNGVVTVDYDVLAKEAKSGTFIKRMYRRDLE